MTFGGFEGFEGFEGFDPSQLLRFLQAQGPEASQLTAETAKWIALEGVAEAPVDAATVAQIAELTRVAQMHVADATGIDSTLQVSIRTVGRGGWIEAATPALQTVLDRIGATLQGDAESEAESEDIASAIDDDDPAAPFTGFLEALAPMLLGVQSGFMVGYLARYLHAQHDLPLPVSPDPGMLFVVPNLDEFESEWSLPRDELRFYVALHEVVHAALHSVPWVQQRLLDLALAYASTLRIDQSALEAQLADFDPAHPEQLEDVLGDPGELLAAFDSPERRAALERLQLFTMVLEGYADEILARVGQPLITSFDRIAEARQRHRIERGDAQRFVERLFGMEMDREHYERGAAFCAGVVERAGAEALNQLWESEAMLPTPSEFDAPGLWLARIEMMGNAGV